MARQVRAFTNLQRFYHRHLIYLTFFFILTGLPLISEFFHWIAYVFSFPFNFLAEGNSDMLAAGMQVVRVIHRVTALIFILVTIPFSIAMLLRVNRWQVWPERWGLSAISEGVSELKKNYVDFGHARFGKYNIGQKAAFWAFFLGLAVLLVSGFVLWFRDLFSAGAVDAARIGHDVAFALIVLTLVLHIYFALFPRNRYGLEAMFRTGTMDEDIVKGHHPKWHEKIKDDPSNFEQAR